MDRVPQHFVLLAGSMEARHIAELLLAEGLGVAALMTERPRGNAAFPVNYRLCDDVKSAEVLSLAKEVRADAIIDAAHGFDLALSVAGWHAAKTLGLPILRLARPLWNIAHNPKVRRVATVRDAMAYIPEGARVFSATGWESLPEFTAFQGSKLLLRRTHEARQEAPFDFIEPVHGVPPFTVESELRLFEELAVDLLICRNLGGRASRPKLDAALRLGIDVILIDPPERPQGLRSVPDVEAMMRWVAAL